MDNNISYEEFENCIKFYLDCDDDQINKDTNLLKDLGIDSLSMFSVMLKVERKFNLKGKVKVNKKLYGATMGDMYNEIIRQLKND
ncbi:acyl carrier protein [Clostridium felsineum]|uniref:Uncharacterized protein n=1 Tax=Clostridium felsineum TaxID=36839 RepID=A0A1S8M9H7_9CLOT|nr:acyl carrier protein [Clostridium felsineum]MCR3757607.1 acyl carrier protein [Clostridium felsineum]URZ03204.1 hypothetical protein CLAUR_032500 [Clostridium felsineum]URZ08456.1 hypothetical protein CLROS_038380 [Clostridium felsineum]URZ13487.1 hypothetical protein CROST_042530 [Clostridium felsineum]URZ14541.1 hypothetical protein CLFE_005380 [Clostridium felsineum DSM 794]